MRRCGIATAGEVIALATSNSLKCPVKEPELGPSAMNRAKEFFCHKRSGPSFVLTVHSNPLSLSLSWEGTLSWLPVVSRELAP